MRRGEENQRQGGGIKSDSMIYTPELNPALFTPTSICPLTEPASTATKFIPHSFIAHGHRLHLPRIVVFRIRHQ